jgi:hypothetical protein
LGAQFYILTSFAPKGSPQKALMEQELAQANPLVSRKIVKGFILHLIKIARKKWRVHLFFCGLPPKPFWFIKHTGSSRKNHLRMDLSRPRRQRVKNRWTNSFPLMPTWILMPHMVAIGEKTGELDLMLQKVAEHYDMETSYAIRNLSSALEPTLILVIGAILILLALAIFLPLWNMAQLIRR